MPNVIDWLNEHWYLYIIFAVILISSIVVFILMYILRKDEKLANSKETIQIGYPSNIYGSTIYDKTTSNSGSYDKVEAPLNETSQQPKPIYDRVPSVSGSATANTYSKGDINLNDSHYNSVELIRQQAEKRAKEEQENSSAGSAYSSTGILFKDQKPYGQIPGREEPQGYGDLPQ